MSVAALLGEMNISSGDDAVVKIGSTFNRTVFITDMEDTNNDGWTYRVEWSDGLVSEGVVAPGETSFEIVRDFSGQTGIFSALVIVRDDATEFDTDRFSVTVKDFSPIITLNGAANINEGDPYVLSVVESNHLVMVILLITVLIGEMARLSKY